MKKLLRSLLAVMLIAMMAIAFTSCAKPEKVEDKLKDMDYEVELIDDEDDLEDMFGELDGLKAALIAVAEDGKSQAYIYWFETKADAKDAVNELRSEGFSEFSDSWRVTRKAKIVIIGFGNGDAFEDACDAANVKAE